MKSRNSVIYSTAFFVIVALTLLFTLIGVDLKLSENPQSILWNIVYKTYPPIMRAMESLKFHNSRQDFLFGRLNQRSSQSKLRKYLVKNGYEDAILSWKDPGEVLSMRKLVGWNFQYHIRLFDDGEVRAHFEYSSEGNPWGHSIGSIFDPQKDYFVELLTEHLSQ